MEINENNVGDVKCEAKVRAAVTAAPEGGGRHGDGPLSAGGSLDQTGRVLFIKADL